METDTERRALVVNRLLEQDTKIANLKLSNMEFQDANSLLQANLTESHTHVIAAEAKIKELQEICEDLSEELLAANLKVFQEQMVLAKLQATIEDMAQRISDLLPKPAPAEPSPFANIAK